MRVEVDASRRIQFNDYSVLSVSIASIGNICQIILDGATYIETGGTQELNAGALIVAGWKQIGVRSYDSDSDEWSSCGHLVLFEISEFDHDKDFVLRGFAKEGGWTEWRFVEPTETTYTVLSRPYIKS